MIWLLATALAYEGEHEVRLAVDALPGTLGEPLTRGALGITLHDEGDGVTVDASGTLRGSTLGESALALERMQVSGGWGAARLHLGRHVHLDLRGAERLDGLSVDVGDGTSAWAGRLWFPEELDLDHPAGTTVLGAQVRGLASGVVLGGRLHGGAGAELRAGEADVAGRLWGAAELRGARGAAFSALVEGDPVAGLRADTRLSLPVARRLDLGLSGRWEDLPRATASPAWEAPQTWLAEDGYGVLAARAAWRGDEGSVVVEAGPVFTADDTGALGRLDLATTLGPCDVGVFGRGAWTGRQGYLGGGLGASGAAGVLTLDGDAGLFRVRHLDQRDSWAGELRARALGDVSGPEGGLAVGLEAAAGADRLLLPWARAGVVVTARSTRSDEGSP